MSPTSTAKPTKAKRKPGSRNAEETQKFILEAALDEFCAHGYDGARIERIVKKAGCNIRMAYHYFGGKEGLYLTVLEGVYGDLRAQEKALNLSHLDPVSAMQKLVEFTFCYMTEHPEFIALVRNENLLCGRMLKKSDRVVQEATPLVGMIREILDRGEAEKVFRSGVDAMHLYVTILSLCFVHISNRYTLSVLFQQNLAEPSWLEERRQHALDVVMSYLKV